MTAALLLVIPIAALAAWRESGRRQLAMQNRRLAALANALADRVHRQSELLSKRAERIQ